MACLISGIDRSGEASACAWMREQRTRRGMRALLRSHHYTVAAVGTAGRLSISGEAAWRRSRFQKVSEAHVGVIFGRTKPIRCFFNLYLQKWTNPIRLVRAELQDGRVQLCTEVVHAYIRERSAESDQRRVGRLRARGVGHDEYLHFHST